MLWFIALLICLIIVATIYIKSLNTHYSYFNERGIPSLPHQFFFGHCKTLWSVPLITRQLQIWTRQLGRIYGLYEGTRPLYIVSDADFLEEVYIKQFSSFHSRRLPFILRRSHGNQVHLFGATGPKWYRQRHIINPTFTSAKLKSMKPFVQDCIDSLMRKLDENCNNRLEFNIYTYYKRLTMDVICRCAFGIDTDMQNDINNPYLKNSEGAITNNLDASWIIRLGYLIPQLVPFLTYIIFGKVILQRLAHKIIPNIEEMPRFWLLRHVKHVINIRTSTNRMEIENRRVDLLQLMLDVATEEPVVDHTNQEMMSKSLHYDEVCSNVMLFMAVGYETTSTALAYSAYVLAKEPFIQNKLQKEIDKIEQGEHEYEQIHQLTYLDWFLREVLRMYPIAPRAMSRECNKTTVVCGYTIEQGCIIQPDVLTIHYDPDLWGPEDPNIFCPERHAKARHPAAFVPFGIGPRNCVGKRFAIMEAKLCLANLLRHYTIRPGNGIEEKLNFKDTQFILQPTDVNIKIEKRTC